MDIANNDNRRGNTRMVTSKRAKSVLGTVAAVSALAAGLVLSVSSPAAASGAACNPGCTAYAEFASYGEVLTIHDYQADGYPTVAILEGNGNLYGVEDHNGYDGPAETFNLSFPEGTAVRYRACLGTFGSHWSCSDWRNDTA